MPPTLLAHHWFFQPRGGERVLAELAALVPDSPILTAFATRDVNGWPKEIAALVPRVRPSRIQPLYRLAEQVPACMPLLLPLLPWGMRRSFSRELAAADRVVVSDAGLAKTLALATAAPTAVYLHSPMRHIWHDAEQTLARLPPGLRTAGDRTLAGLRRIDRESASRVAAWGVNSRTTAERAAAAYGLPVERFPVIHPPVEVPAEPPADLPRSGLLVVSGMEPYKNDILAVQAAARLDRAITVVGDGPERRRLATAAGSRARFLGKVSDADLDQLYRTHSALLFCGVEDFGIVPVEAAARGCPVVALGKGGATETIEPAATGVFFSEPAVDAVIAAIEASDHIAWNRTLMHARAARFAPMRFRAEISDWLDRVPPRRPS
jgi:glycosyltransferase involved in cell wall biosynthesis